MSTTNVKTLRQWAGLARPTALTKTRTALVIIDIQQDYFRDKLQERNIETLILCGLMTHMCVDTTARGALEYGYRAIVARDACATRDLPGPDGSTIIPHSIIHAATLAALADRFADVMKEHDMSTIGSVSSNSTSTLLQRLAQNTQTTTSSTQSLMGLLQIL